MEPPMLLEKLRKKRSAERSSSGSRAVRAVEMGSPPAAVPVAEAHEVAARLAVAELKQTVDSPGSGRLGAREKSRELNKS